LRSGLHAPLSGLTHGSAISNPTLQLIRNVAGHQVGVGLRLFNLNDIELNSTFCNCLEFSPQVFNPFTVTSDKYSRTSRMNIDYAVLSTTVNFDPGNARIGERFIFVLDTLPQTQVLLDQVAVGAAILRVPMGFPVFNYSKTEPVRVGLMPHA
jgi:hypothetical protein